MLTWLEISKSALIHNLRQFRKIIGSKIKLMAVVKSNAYGHGMIECAKIFEKNGADYLGVVNLDEALQLRRNNLKKPILVLTFWPTPMNYPASAEPRFSSGEFQRITNKKIEEAIKKNIEFCAYTDQQLDFLAKISQKIGKKAKIHLKIDTGTSRIGVLPENSLNFALKCLKLPNLELKGIFTHFAKSEAYNQKYTLLQTRRLKKIAQEIILKTAPNLFSRVLKFNATADKNKTILPIIHAACTASTIINSMTHFDLVRIGIGLYGLWPSQATKHYGASSSVVLKSALTWKTRVIQVKELSKGTPIGYDCTYRCKKRTKIAILPVGYWDGYDRKLSNCGEVLIRGRRAPVRGRICMNLTIVEVTKIPGVKVGDEVVLIGRQNDKEITAEELAEKIGTINYEIVTRINPQLSRIYK